jgi:hypothetical protein
MTKFQINKKAALIATAIGTLLVSNFATYKNAYSGGYRTSIVESRVGYMEVPETSGAIIISEVNGKPHHYFEPYPTTPTFSTKTAWNSDENRKALEWSIKNESVRQDDQDQRINVASVACVAQTTPNFWDCTWRELGKSYNNHWRVEVNPATGRWQSN